MDYFDDIQIEESDGFDFSDSDLDDLFEEDDDTQTFRQFLVSNFDF